MTDEKPTADSGISDDVAAILGEIGSILGEEGLADAAKADHAFEYPCNELLRLLPPQYLRETGSNHAGESILLSLTNLYEQLAIGKIKLTVSELAYFLPLHIIYQAAFDDKSEVELPLSSVVASVGISKIVRNTHGTVRDYGIDGIEDIFKASDAVAYAGPEDEDEDDDDSPVVFFGDDEGESERVVAEPDVVPEAEPQEEVVPEAVESESEKESENVVSEHESVSDSFEYPALLIAKLLPESWLVENAFDKLGDLVIPIATPDLSDQLKTGQVTMACNMLAIQLPPEVLTSEVSHQDSPEADLDLKVIVESLGTAALLGEAGDFTQDFDIDWMADPFEKPDVLPPLVKKVKPVKTAEVPTAVRSLDEIEQKEVPYDAKDEDGPESEYHELPGNVNINTASADELMQLDGMTNDIAQQIILFRSEHKGFKTIFQLHRIPGVEDSNFEQMTGMQVQMKRFHRRRRLVSFLKIPAKRVSDLHLVAKAMSEKSGFRAAIVSDRDGLVLAQYGLGESGYDLSAVLPRITSQLQYNMSLADVGDLDSFTLRVDGDFYTFVPRSNVTLTVVHEENQITRHGLELIEKVAEELEWLLSERAYVGPYISED